MDGKQLLLKHFQVEAERVPFQSKEICYESNGLLYHIIDATDKEQQYLYELHQMAQHMVRQGEKRTAVFLRARNGRFLVTEEERDFVVLVSSRPAPMRAFTGERLARFHLRGQSLLLQVQSASELGSWRASWEQRLEKIEKSANGLLKEQDDPFARLIVESFPYYMGLTENALQYVADTEIDEAPQQWDLGTICHRSFSEKSWLREPAVHQPFNWVFDYAARDIAEWIRSEYWQGALFYRTRFIDFIRQYEQVRPLSPFAWRLIYARLLFPAHYFECIERYFAKGSLHIKKENEEKLKKYLANSREYEEFLAFFYDRAGVSSRRWNMPAIHWLK
ncbi:spore coat putative kinase YutH [Pseudobacillus badius]|uniref:spore coat putative kinase YutH n=1 Tax=Bacillus badius TaxID=1455 RepID=UPI0024A28714|nr:spore coat protein YutH [Bacillus badius]MED0667803.1 spore coat protein YutH [Bacillus badius]GLY09554.1 endospore coat-associated protein YutH [Bacillus badius]